MTADAQMIAKAKQPVKINPRRLAHVNCYVAEIGRTRSFYSDICGMEEVFEEEAINAAFFSNGNSHHDLGLMQVPPEAGGARLHHLGFEMSNERDLVAALDRLKDAGFSDLRTVSHGLAHSVYISDPDGNKLEFYADVVDDWRRFWKENLGNFVTGSWTPDAVDDTDPTPRHPTRFEAAAVKEAAIKSRRVVAAGLATTSFEAMLEFYTRVVGLDADIFQLPRRHAVLRGSTGDDALYLEEVADAAEAGFSRMVMELDPARLAEARTACAARGIDCGHDAYTELFIHDPDGFRIDFRTLN